MKFKLLIAIGLTALSLSAVTSDAFADPAGAPTIVDTVREATRQYRNFDAAGPAGYGLLYGCVSGPDEGAMGIHFVNGALAGDGVVDLTKPEALMYDVKGGRRQLAGVEYVVLADAWDAANPNGGPPVLGGQVFNYVPSPNRYRLPAFYELHVWAWTDNPNGTFADWNPRLSCEDYTG